MKNFLIIGCLLIMSMSLSAQNFGYVNTQELIQQIPAVKEANANIETYTAQLQRKGQDMLKALQTKYQELDRKQQQGAISPLKLDEEAAKLKEEEGTIMRFEQESQQKIASKSDDLLRPLREQIEKAIKDVATENNFDYIFDYSMGIVLYADKSSDVSDKVKTKLGL